MTETTSGASSNASLIPARVDSVAIGVGDVRESARFYREVMGFEQLPDTPGEFPVGGLVQPAADLIVSFQLGNLVLVVIDRQLLAEEESIEGLPPAGASTMAVRVPRDMVDQYMDRLEAAGARILSPAQDHGALRIGFAADPDGHVWEVIQDPLARA